MKEPKRIKLCTAFNAGQMPGSSMSASDGNGFSAMFDHRSQIGRAGAAGLNLGGDVQLSSESMLSGGVLNTGMAC